ncbi:MULTISPECIES: ABC transporter permease [unclassified Polaromonas]|uniref:ABC transporter permease n=1 Tax=unclassified Polaromonas TaxID=2638319 RepID=UPI001A29B633|nr:MULTISPECIES: ABC transporter permease [unclassified Polaromonas]MBG6071702.1 peptide/nickel transport system permease protein [Polaromonas sp. CG_9.7]MBG6113703.1 peptide/nickel transport system permease protein [Polaromonas sp. CG_9.2]MDH6184397.1 peptide/nickel transport system permease protein [Polaromonas sp. CG_23.6]
MQTAIPATVPARAMQWRSLEFILGALLTGAMLTLVLLSVWIFPDRGSLMDLAARLTQPFTAWAHPLGTDPLGRDVLARVLVGGRISLMVGFVSVLGASVLGITVGLIAGYYRGFWDMLLMRCVDVQLALPFILVALTFISILGGGLSNIILFMIVSQWVQYARLVRGMVLSVREREFVQAARSFGVRDFAMIRHHILPNIIGPVIILMTLNVANNILLESSLTFLGLGVDPLIPSWGGMLADGRTYMQTAWWVTVFPGLAIMFTVLGLNLLGDWLRDRIDPTGKL